MAFAKLTHARTGHRLGGLRRWRRRELAQDRRCTIARPWMGATVSLNKPSGSSLDPAAGLAGLARARAMRLVSREREPRAALRVGAAGSTAGLDSGPERWVSWRRKVHGMMELRIVVALAGCLARRLDRLPSVNGEVHRCRLRRVRGPGRVAQRACWQQRLRQSASQRASQR